MAKKAKLISGDKYAILRKDSLEDETGKVVKVWVAEKEVNKVALEQELKAVTDQIALLQERKSDINEMLNAISTIQ